MTKKPEERLVGVVYDLLGGVGSRDAKGLPRQKYLKENSPEEKHARRALAMLLASDEPLDPLVRRLLAGLIDSEFEYSTRPKAEKDKAVERRIVFTQPSRRAVEHNRRLQVGFEFWLEMGKPKPGENLSRGKKAAAIRKIMDKYEVSSKMITDAYSYAMKTGWVG
jgi:hypothetical protein